VIVLLCVNGLVALALAFDWAFSLLKYAGAAYLIWIGIKIWRTAGNCELGSVASRKTTWGLLKSGFAIGIGNPKAILFHASLLPVFFDLRSLTVAKGLEISTLVLIVDMLVLASVAAAAGNAARLLRSPVHRRNLERGGGAAIIGAGVALAVR
jgi:threonine/homoserine/homoserine lactone efflux protein